MNEIADPRTEELFLMSSPLPIVGIIGLWLMFILKWGPAYMKDREPYDLKQIMIVYNIIQVVLNTYIVYITYTARNVVSWRCTPVDYSNSYWGVMFVWFTHKYFMLKVLDLMDTVFFVLRKKQNHISFLHVYHHFGMCIAGWIGTKFIGGGHSYYVGAANCLVHSVLYSYYLLTAYDSKYSKLLWLKKFITQLQLIQFTFLLFTYGQLLFRPDCEYPKLISWFLVPQNFFMMVLFGEFYITNYHLNPRRKRKELERKLQEAKENNEAVQEKKEL